MFDVLKLQKQLVAAACPSGSEYKAISPLLADLAKPFVDEVYTDAMGNLICHKKGNGKKVMLCAHMDAIGLMVTSVGDDGAVWFTNVGGLRPVQMIGARVRFENGLQGIVRLREEGKNLGLRTGALSLSQLYVDIGALSGEQARSMVKVGDVAIFAGEPREVGGGNIMGPYADDLIGCVVLLLAMEQSQNTPNDVYYVFSVQEEVGCRGSKTAAFAIAPDLGIAVDVTGTGDVPTGKVPMDVKLGAGPTIKIKDGSVICSHEANALLEQAAEKAGILCQREILLAGGTDTSSIQMAGNGAIATCVSVPTRHIHSPAETFNRGDVEQAGKLLSALLAEAL